MSKYGQMATNVKEIVKLALLVALLTFVVAFLQFLYSHILRPRWYTRRIPGPKHHSWAYGHVRMVAENSPAVIHQKWFKEYGQVVRFQGFFGQPRLSMLDRVALHHVLVSEPYNFPKPSLMRRSLASVTGYGVIVAEGADHQRQRKIMNPSFGAPHMKSMYPLFIDKAITLRDTMLKLVSRSAPTPIDIYDYANRVTLDVIGAAGFGYEANATELGKDSKLFDSLNRVFGTLSQFSLYEVFIRRFPALDILPNHSARVMATRRAHGVIRDIAVHLVHEKKMAVLGSSNNRKPVEASQMAGRDLLSVLMKANMAAGLRPQQKMTDEEFMAQISTILFAGNDTTANGISWAFYGLCKYPETQKKLREEINSIPTESPTFDELNALPYLDAVVRETLRVFAPVAGTDRVAAKDSIIPLETPFIDSDGVAHDSIFVAKNTIINFPILAFNTHVDIWGPDADEFNPSRWIDGKLPDGVLEVPSVAFPTFIAGPRACIGFRFSLIEMKTILFSLVRVMHFELAVPADDIVGRPSVVTRPKVKSRPNESWQLPLLVMPVDPSG